MARSLSRTRALAGPARELAFLLLCVNVATLGRAQVSVPSATAEIEERSTAADEMPEGVDPNAYWAFVESALQLRRSGDLERAQRALEGAHAMYPNARTFRGLGVLAADRGRYEEACIQLQAALASEVRPLAGALRAVTVELLARVRAKRDAGPPPPPDAERAGVPPVSVVVAQPSKGPLEAAREPSAPQLASTEARAPSRVWKSPWLWCTVGGVLVASAVTAVVLSRRSEDYERGTSGMLVGSAR